MRAIDFIWEHTVALMRWVGSGFRNLVRRDG